MPFETIATDPNRCEYKCSWERLRGCPPEEFVVVKVDGGSAHDMVLRDLGPKLRRSEADGARRMDHVESGSPLQVCLRSEVEAVRSEV